MHLFFKSMDDQKSNNPCFYVNKLLEKVYFLCDDFYIGSLADLCRKNRSIKNHTPKNKNWKKYYLDKILFLI